MTPSKKKKKKGRREVSSRAATLIPWLAVALVLLTAVIWFLTRSQETTINKAFEQRIIEMAAVRGVEQSAVSGDDPIRKINDVFVRTWRITFPSREARDGFVGDLEIESAIRNGDLRVPQDLSLRKIILKVVFDLEAFDLQLSIEEPSRVTTSPTPTPTPIPSPTARPVPPKNSRGRLAILLDDAGQNLDLVAAAAALRPEVAVAILPFLPSSAETAEEMHRNGHEVWLHLPMEPEGYPADDPGAGAILVGMDGVDLQTTIHTALNNIPHAVGVNNHMGSRATADLRLMTWVMQELKARNMAFIDSRTTIRTVAEEAARAQGVPTNRRHVFLDNERQSAAIRRQLEEAVYRCRIEGEIIAIGHLSKVTIKVLAKELPGLKERGADLVAPSELMK